MTLASGPATAEAPPPAIGMPLRIGVFIGTIVIIVMLAILPLLTPFYIHRALDAADSTIRLGLESSVAYAASDLSVENLVLGNGEFEFPAPDGTPFYDDSERGHLRDARTVLWLALIVGGISIIAIGAAYARVDTDGRAAIWRTISRAGLATAVGIVVLGLLSVVAFGTLFELFHRIFFPGGNYSFDPSTQRLVQLYPFTFWQITAAVLGVLVFLVSVATWLLGRHFGRRGDKGAPG